ncbi:hypothetical protein [Candidatus Neoehrlichia procyonis]|uniref:Uncharacterized protein n=1 Tax=Candidatus Neoehrlichia procyonis str. RAC413 TaxID=1359163 RepID=A0A0F3NM97_9RICK|nr:hypothetical protein [Candidatus Neoehrlichia lotoris]KJV68827.1 hypothetical protein NLO413_0192 [Candidatus Neoehrlichia lotoris str. RAC413]
MAKGGKVAKTASKNNPMQRNKNAVQKIYDGKPVKPVKYINRELGQVFMAGQFENGSLVEDNNKYPIKWSNI